jgi:hypothetical protein
MYERARGSNPRVRPAAAVAAAQDAGELWRRRSRAEARDERRSREQSLPLRQQLPTSRLAYMRRIPQAMTTPEWWSGLDALCLPKVLIWKDR